MKLAAIIIETRPSEGLKKAVASVNKFIPEWDKYAFGSESTRPFFEGFNYKNLKVPLSTLRDYNVLMTSLLFWDRWKDYDKVLIFQSDTEILDIGIEYFLEWDYVGAPWKFQDHGGNGGLSIRNPKIMIEILNQATWSPACFEDVFFCNEMFNKKIGKLAPRKICKMFSAETIFETGTLGYHAIQKHLTKEQVHKILHQYK